MSYILSEPNMFVLLPHLLQVGVTPDLPISKDSGDHAPLAVVLQPLGGGAPLQGADLPAAGAAHIHRQQQLAAGQPEDGMTSRVVYNFQEELPVVIINLLGPQAAIVIHRKNVSPVDLQEIFPS